MATIENRFFSGINGKFGPLVGYQWKGRQCLRTLPMCKRDPRTEAQVAQRIRFGTLSRLGSMLMPAVKIGFRCAAIVGQTTEKNIFVKTNKQCITVEAGVANVDYTSLKVADGPLPTVDFGEPAMSADGTVSVAFSDNAMGVDRHSYVMLAAHIPGQGLTLMSQPVFRTEGMVTLSLPQHCRASESHLYGFCWDGYTLASPSCYVGSLNTTCN